MKSLFILSTVLCLSLVAHADFDDETWGYGGCVRRCAQRSVTGSCVRFARDYCGRGNAVACVPYCTSRDVGGRCRKWGADYCGNYAECHPYCRRTSVTGSCTNWGVDQCFSHEY